MSKKEKLESNILDNIETVSSIMCSKCQKEDNNYGADAFDIVDGLIEAGWYATKNNVYCPDCNKKRLAKK